MQVLVSYLSFRSRRLRKVLEGHPIVVIQDGKVLEQNLHRQRMTPDELAEEMRMQSIGSLRGRAVGHPREQRLRQLREEVDGRPPEGERPSVEPSSSVTSSSCRS